MLVFCMWWNLSHTISSNYFLSKKQNSKNGEMYRCNNWCNTCQYSFKRRFESPSFQQSFPVMFGVYDLLWNALSGTKQRSRMSLGQVILRSSYEYEKNLPYKRNSPCKGFHVQLSLVQSMSVVILDQSRLFFSPRGLQ